MKHLQTMQDYHQRLLLAASRDASAKSNGNLGDSAACPQEWQSLDHVDVFERLMDEPDKAPVMLRLLSREVLKDTAEYAARKIENFAFECSEMMAKELEVGSGSKWTRAFIAPARTLI